MDWLLPAIIVAAVISGALLVMLRTRDAMGGESGLGGRYMDAGATGGATWSESNGDGGWGGGGGGDGRGGGD